MTVKELRKALSHRPDDIEVYMVMMDPGEGENNYSFYLSEVVKAELTTSRRISQICDDRLEEDIKDDEICVIS